jgi:glycosyltransferase involved in cell wall biosynthesis
VSTADQSREGVSVVMPVRLRGKQNQEFEWLLTAVESLLDQQDGPMQVVLVDDGSSYDFVPAVRALLSGAPEIEVTALKGRERGLVPALNKGLAAAKHPWIARLDADDRWTPGKLAAQRAFLRDNPECTLCFGGMILVDAEGATIEKISRGMSWDFALSQMRASVCPVPHGAILARRQVFEVLGRYSGSGEAFACEDYHLWAEWARFFPVGGVEAYLLEYRVHDQAISATHVEAQRENTRKIAAGLRGLQDPGRYTRAVRKLSGKLSAAPMEGAAILYSLWSRGGLVRADREDLEDWQTVMFDRVITTPDQNRDMLHVEQF